MGVKIVLPLTLLFFAVALFLLKKNRKTGLADIILQFFYSALSAGSLGTSLAVVLAILNGLFPNSTFSVLILPSFVGTITFSILSFYTYVDAIFDLRKKHAEGKRP